jgi:integrase
MLGLLAGLRTGELCALAWRNVDLHAGVLRFMGKGGKAAIVTMPAQLVAELERWSQVVVAAGVEPTGELPVVCALRFPHGPLGRAGAVDLVAVGLTSNGLARIVHDRGVAIGIPDLRPHDLRRTLAGILDDQGARLQDVRLVLRHDRLATTEAYLRDNPRRVERRMRRLTLPRS